MAFALLQPDEISTTSVTRNQGQMLLAHVESYCLLRRPTASEISVLKEMFYAMISKSGLPIRRQISIALARNPYTPRQIAIYLALEPVEVATPVLLYSPVLGDRDLEAILKRGDAGHARVIARRSELGANIVKMLYSASDNDPSLLDILERNPDNLQLLAGLKEEPAPDQLENSILPLEVVVADPVPSPTGKEKDLSGTLLDLAAKGGRLGSNLKKQARDIRRPTSVETGRRLLHAAKLGSVDRVTSEIYDACGLSTAVVRRFLDNQDAGRLASLFCTLELKTDIAARLLLLLCPTTGRNYPVFKRIMDEFRNLDREAAIKYFRQLDPEFEIRQSNHHIVPPAPQFMHLLRSRRREMLSQNSTAALPERSRQVN